MFISAARLADVPARYVSGYLMMNDRVDQDASHAWAEAHIDGGRRFPFAAFLVGDGNGCRVAHLGIPVGCVCDII